MDTPNPLLAGSASAYGFAIEADFNSSLAKYYEQNCLSDNDNEIISSDEDLTSEVREYTLRHFGPAKHEYDVRNIRATLTRSFIKRSTIKTYSPGTKAPSIIKVSVALEPAPPTLSLKINLTNAYVKLSKENNELWLHWDWLDTFGWTGSDADKSFLADHYERSKSTLVGRIPWPSRALDLWIYLLQGFPGTLNWVAMNQALLDSTELPARASLHTNPAATDALVVTLLPDAFPEIASGTPPLDIALFAGLFAPPGSLEYRLSEYANGNLLAGYESRYL